MVELSNIALDPLWLAALTANGFLKKPVSPPQQTAYLRPGGLKQRLINDHDSLSSNGSAVARVRHAVLRNDDDIPELLLWGAAWTCKFCFGERSLLRLLSASYCIVDSESCD